MGKTGPKASMLIGDRAEIVLEAIRSGMSNTSAAALAGIDKQNFHEWIQRGLRGEKPYAEFVAKLKQAIGLFEKEHLAIIKAAATKGSKTRTIKKRTLKDGTVEVEETIKTSPIDWVPAAWLLERRFKSVWGRYWAPEDGLELPTNTMSAWTEEIKKSIEGRNEN